MIHFFRSYSSQPNLLQVVSKLRNQTFLSMNLCRKAAVDSNLDFQKALAILTKSSATAINCSAESSVFGKDGVIGIMGDGNMKCLIKLRCDSDFVALNHEFEALAEAILAAALGSTFSSDCILPRPFNRNLKEVLECFRSKFRENIGIESVKTFEASSTSESNSILGHYLHQRSGSHLGKMGAVVNISFKNSENFSKLEDFSRLIARQTVALNDLNITIPILLDSTYLFEPVRKVSEFIKSKEREINDQIFIEDLYFAKIK